MSHFPMLITLVFFQIKGICWLGRQGPGSCRQQSRSLRRPRSPSRSPRWLGDQGSHLAGLQGGCQAGSQGVKGPHVTLARFLAEKALEADEQLCQCQERSKVWKYEPPKEYEPPNFTGILIAGSPLTQNCR